VVLAGTGPVGMRAGAMLGSEGAEVVLTSRKQDRAEAAAAQIAERFNINCSGVAASDPAGFADAVKDANVVFAAGGIGIQLLAADAWQNNPNIEMVADCNAQPPLGIEGLEATDKAKERFGKICFGALGIGGLKLKLHRELIGRLFKAQDQVFDAEEIYAAAKEMA